jgi:hypothetical protein
LVFADDADLDVFKRLKKQRVTRVKPATASLGMTVELNTKNIVPLALNLSHEFSNFSGVVLCSPINDVNGLELFLERLNGLLDK